MKKLAKKIKVFVVVATSCLSFQAHADIVFDPSNYVENLITAIHSVSTEINTAQSYSEHVRSTIELRRATTALGNIAGLAGLNEEYALYRDLTSANMDLKDVMQRSLEYTRKLQGIYGASDFSWEEFVKARDEMDMERGETIAGQYEQINDSMLSAATRRKQALNSLESATGQTSATQAVGTQIDILIGQQQQVVNALAQQRNKDANDVFQNIAARKALKDYNDKEQKSLRDSSARFNTEYAK